METSSVAPDNSRILAVKLGRETSLATYSPDKRSIYLFVIIFSILLRKVLTTLLAPGKYVSFPATSFK